MRYLKLANPNGVFFDPQTKLDLTGERPVPLLEPLGQLTRQWLQGGGIEIVELDEPPAPIPEYDGVDLEEIPENDQIKLFNEMPWNELRTYAKEVGVELGRKDSRDEVIQKILDIIRK